MFALSFSMMYNIKYRYAVKGEIEMFGLKSEDFYLIIEILKKYSQKIEWVKIFGSRARGDFKKISDIDLAISLKNDILLELKDEFAESNLQYTVDIVNYKNIGNMKLKEYIDREGKFIFLTDTEGRIIMTEGKLLDKLQDFFKALEKLERALEKDPKIDDLYLDATIQRFEFVYELSWKLMKGYLEYNGTEVTSPRETFREGFKNGIIDDASDWIKMMENRNRTSHTYDEGTAWEIYGKIKNEYIKMFKKFAEVMDKKIKLN